MHLCVGVGECVRVCIYACTFFANDTSAIISHPEVTTHKITSMICSLAPTNG